MDALENWFTEPSFEPEMITYLAPQDKHGEML